MKTNTKPLEYKVTVSGYEFDDDGFEREYTRSYDMEAPVLIDEQCEAMWYFETNRSYGGREYAEQYAADFRSKGFSAEIHEAPYGVVLHIRKEVN